MPSKLNVKYHSRFKKDYKRLERRGYDLQLFWDVLERLRSGESLPPKYCDHPLTNFPDFPKARDCHIKPDWVLIYAVESDVLTLVAIRTGTHSDLGL